MEIKGGLGTRAYQPTVKEKPFLKKTPPEAGNPKWRDLCKVPLDDVYSSTPDEAYYEKPLGKRPE